VGPGARVAVFDTSPFSRPGRWGIDWIEPYLDLRVSHPEPMIALGSEGGSGDFRDHGLFVSGLIHAVAPESEIHLIRVLNQYNQGDLGTLVRVLNNFIQGSRNGRGWLDRTVLNLSLGVLDEPEEHKPWLSKMRERMVKRDQFLHFQRDPDWKVERTIVCLETVLSLAVKSGAMIVAASGNKSDAGEAQDALLPAAYPFVLGVAGHNKAQKRSSFSNKGNIAAPGGDIPPRAKLLDDEGHARNPDHWLVGLSLRSEPEQGYMYWMGTSFAAPLVTGQAARALAKNHKPGKVRRDIEDAAVGPNRELGKGCSKCVKES
jgi:hypothetical protein